MLGNRLVFIVSLHFMTSNLYKLVNNLPKEELKFTSKDIGNIELTSQKGVYPHEYIETDSSSSTKS